MSQCYFCGGEQIEELTTFVYEDHGQIWLVRNVPTYICSQCGEREYTQTTTHRILLLLKQPPRPAEIVHVPAYDLTA